MVLSLANRLAAVTALATMLVRTPLPTTDAAWQEPNFRSQSNVVVVPALVRDKRGNVVYGLRSEDFVIEDDGMVQAAHLDEAAEFQPVSLVIAIQRGRRAAFEFARIHGLSSMLEPIFEQGTTQTALVLFDSQVHLVEGFTHDHNAITRELNALRPGDGGAAILDAVNYSVKLLDQISQTSQRVAAADQRDS